MTRCQVVYHVVSRMGAVLLFFGLSHVLALHKICSWLLFVEVVFYNSANCARCVL